MWKKFCAWNVSFPVGNPVDFSMASPRHREAFGRSASKSRMSGAWLSAGMWWTLIQWEAQNVDGFRLQLNHPILRLLKNWSIHFGDCRLTMKYHEVRFIASENMWKDLGTWGGKGIINVNVWSNGFPCKKYAIVPALGKTPCLPWRFKLCNISSLMFAIILQFRHQLQMIHEHQPYPMFHDFSRCFQWFCGCYPAYPTIKSYPTIKYNYIYIYLWNIHIMSHLFGFPMVSRISIWAREDTPKQY